MLFANSLTIAPDAQRLFGLQGLGAGSPSPTKRAGWRTRRRDAAAPRNRRGTPRAGALRGATCGRSLERCETSQQLRAATPAARQARPHRPSGAPRTWDQIRPHHSIGCCLWCCMAGQSCSTSTARWWTPLRRRAVVAHLGWEYDVDAEEVLRVCQVDEPKIRSRSSSARSIGPPPWRGCRHWS